MLSRRLQRKGYIVHCADGAAQADERLRENEFDLILLDIMMPNVDGFQYLRQIRERWDAAEMPVIMATAKTDSEDIVQALKSGANDYVTKPLDFQVVLARINTQMRLKGMTQQLAEAHRLLKEDLERAARFQQSQLPSREVAVSGCQFAWTYLPCDALGGDFLDIIPLDQARTAFYVLDVCGHGTPAALMSAAAARALSVTHDESSIVAKWTKKGFMRGNRLEIMPPDEVTARLNRQFELDIEDGKYFTIAYAVIDTEECTLTYTLAGHPPGVLVSASGELRPLPCEGIPVGVLAGDDITEDSFQRRLVDVAPGDRVYFFSDGLLEEVNSDGEQFGENRLHETVTMTRGDSLQESVDRVLEVIREFCDHRPFADDMSILALEVTGKEDDGDRA